MRSRLREDSFDRRPKYVARLFRDIHDNLALLDEVRDEGSSILGEPYRWRTGTGFKIRKARKVPGRVSRNRPLMEFRENQELDEWARSREVVAIYLHGSQTRSPRTDSDIDIALLLRCLPDWEATESIREEALVHLSAALDCSPNYLDIQFLNGAPPAFSFRVIRDRHLLWEGNHKSRVDFERELLIEYLDFRYYEEQYDRAVRSRLREDTFGRRPKIRRSAVS